MQDWRADAVLPPTLIIAGGATGGHTTAAQVIGGIAKSGGVRVLWLVRPDSYELQAAGETNIEYRTILIVRPKLKEGVKFVRSIASCSSLIRSANARAVVLTGGWVSLPAGIAAVLSRRRLAIHEQTLIPGRTPRIFNLLGIETWITYEETRDYFLRKRRIFFTSFPVRPALQVQLTKQAATKLLGLDPRQPVLFVAGGGSGSEMINSFVARNMPALLRRYQIVHQVGGAPALSSDLEAMLSCAGKLDERLRGRYVARERFTAEQVNQALRGSDLVLGRAGAAFCNELMALGTPALLVPYPHARSNEQRALAEVVAASGQAVVVDDSRLAPGADRDTVSSLLNIDYERLRKPIPSGDAVNSDELRQRLWVLLDTERGERHA
jgi:UDP-N-acetylglucosamine--N-acetylmuramyl-(pentapeptide) pyrophosphoryl-undecaprenol N-acetylglucosamine transferase